MPGKIFISCGQATTEERKVAADIKAWLRGEGFNPYVAIQTQSLQDVNSEIIGNLKSADFYIFIDFKREQINTSANGITEYRGSLFTHQELAIAYLLEFEYVICLRENNVRLEGLGQYLLSNAIMFSDKRNILPIIQKEILQRTWEKTYSRHLVVSGPFDAGQWPFGDHTGTSWRHIWHIAVENWRSDSAAFNTVARLDKISDPYGTTASSRDRSFLKWAGKKEAFQNTILPADQANFDCLSIDVANPFCVYLHSEEDRHPRQPIISNTGLYLLHYELLAIGFPKTNFDIEINLTGNINTTTLRLL